MGYCRERLTKNVIRGGVVRMKWFKKISSIVLLGFSSSLKVTNLLNLYLFLKVSFS